MQRENSLIVSLDIGTYKTAVVVAEPTPEGIDVIGIGTALSQGLRKGLILNVEAAVPVIRKAVEEAEVGASCEIHNVCVGLTGGFVEGLTSQGVVVVRDQEVAQDDVSRVTEVARTLALPPDCEILHVLPQEFLVDGQNRGRNPVGSAGVRLEADVQVIMVSTSAVQTLLRCCERADLQVRNLTLAVLAAAEAVLTPEEKELGVALLDIGGGTTGMAAFHRGVVQHTALLPIGGSHITNDLAAGLRAPLAEIEKLKQRHGCALVNLLTPGEMIEMPRVGGRDPIQVPRRRLSEIIELRVQEIFTLVKEQFAAAGILDQLGCGIVLTGGSAIMPGMTELAERIFHLPVRRGVPPQLGALVDQVNSPMYATGVGLILWEMQHMHANGVTHSRSGHGWQRVRERVVEWIREFF
ncbi:MAG: cell division protein FtsA [Deltaproteobacteria bacterium]|nr:cell division protein FtsA [Deltaproteobacteria bacterium]